MKRSLFALIRILMGDVRTLLRQEFMLVKTELAEKASRMKGDVVALAIGGIAAWAGSMVVLIGLSLLIAWAFTFSGIAPLLAGFIGFAIIGLILTCVGAVMALQAIHKLSRESLVPEKSVEALQHLAATESIGENWIPESSKGIQTQSDIPPESKLSSEELKRVAFLTEDSMDKTLKEMQQHVSPKQIKERIKSKLSSRKLRAGLITVGAGLIGIRLMKRFRHA
ncbi:MAG TPA: phage holin family protein [Verrucomicrobiae bacterium]|nr:phage holin family protein [Verrucomicrobiae bacterium]